MDARARTSWNNKHNHRPHKKSSGRTLGMETLETRLLLSGSSTASVLANSQNTVRAAAIIRPVTTAAPAAPATTNATAASVATASTQVITPTALTGIIKNPGVGYQTFYTSAAGDTQEPSNTMYVRFDWSQIETAPGVYNFSAIDQALAQAKAAGQRLAFRIMPFEDGNAGPTGLKNAGLPGFSFTFYGKQVWCPDLNSSAVQADLGKLIAALGQRYGNNPAIDSVDISFVGAWGEYNFWNCSPAPTYPTTQTLNWLTDQFVNNFHEPILVGAGLYQSNLTAWNYAMSKGVGWRQDSWGHWTDSWNEQTDLYPEVIANNPNQWKTAPIIMEPYETMADWTNQPWQQTLQWAIDNHVSEISNKSAAIPSWILPSLNTMLAKLGYRYVLDQASHLDTVTAGSNLALNLNWTNAGNAPMYMDRDLVVKIGNTVIDTGENFKGKLPGNWSDSLSLSTAGLAPGTYNIQIGLAAPGTNTPDINLAIQGSGPWYNVGTVTVAAAASDTTPPSAALAAANITAAGGASDTFTVTYTDDTAVKNSTLNNANLMVTGPNGYSQAATLVSVSATANSPTLTATYQIAAPGGTWDYADNGTYTVSLLANAVTDTGGNAVPAATLGTFGVSLPLPVQVTTPTPLTGILKNPGTGYETFYASDSADKQEPSATMYQRFDWSQIETAPGVYNFTVIDQALAAAQAAGQRFAFRIMPFEAGNAGPTGLKNAGLPGSTFTFYGTTAWMPDLNQAAVQQDLAKLIAALGQRYGNNPAIDSIDLGFVGDWGNFDTSATSPALALPSTATLEWLVNQFHNNFKVPVLVDANLYKSNPTAFAYALQQGFGWRSDGWGDTSSGGIQSSLLPAVVAANPNAWKTAPVILETSGTMATWSSTTWQQTLQWAISNHVSEIDDKSSVIPANMLASVNSMLGQLGYHYTLNQASYVQDVTAGGSVTLNTSWTNSGDAPLYMDRDLLVKIGNTVIDTGHDFKGKLPGGWADSVALSTQGLAPGTYTVQIGLGAPGSQTPDITLGIQGSGPWYTLGTLTVLAAPVATTSSPAAPATTASILASNSPATNSVANTTASTAASNTTSSASAAASTQPASAAPVPAALGTYTHALAQALAAFSGSLDSAAHDATPGQLASDVQSAVQTAIDQFFHALGQSPT